MNCPVCSLDLVYYSEIAGVLLTLVASYNWLLYCLEVEVLCIVLMEVELLPQGISNRRLIHFKCYFCGYSTFCEVT